MELKEKLCAGRVHHYGNAMVALVNHAKVLSRDIQSNAIELPDFSLRELEVLFHTLPGKTFDSDIRIEEERL